MLLPSALRPSVAARLGKRSISVCCLAFGLSLGTTTCSVNSCLESFPQLLSAAVNMVPRLCLPQRKESVGVQVVYIQ
jgi:hypothetical protein